MEMKMKEISFEKMHMFLKNEPYIWKKMVNQFSTSISKIHKYILSK